MMDTRLTPVSNLGSIGVSPIDPFKFPLGGFGGFFPMSGVAGLNICQKTGCWRLQGSPYYCHQHH